MPHESWEQIVELRNLEIVQTPCLHGFTSVPLRLNESTESFGTQTHGSVTLYYRAACLLAALCRVTLVCLGVPNDSVDSITRRGTIGRPRKACLRFTWSHACASCPAMEERVRMESSKRNGWPGGGQRGKRSSVSSHKRRSRLARLAHL